MIRIFRAMPSVYESARAALNTAYGYPNYETKTETAIPPVSELPIDAQGRVYLAVSSEFCDYTLPAQLLPQLIASGEVEEIDEATYLAAQQ